MSTVTYPLLAALIVLDAFLIRMVWRLSNRLSRLEGRLERRG